MLRADSLPDINSDRGRGLADLKGWDALDRRLDVEKKEKYGQALRDQMAQNSARGAASEASRASSRMSPSVRVAGEVMTGLPPRNSPREEMHVGRGGSEYSGAPPTPLMGAVAGADGIAAAKVAQVQEIMRQRLQEVQQEQRRQWEEVQNALRHQSQGVLESAEQVVRQELGRAMQDQAAEIIQLQKSLDDMMQAHHLVEQDSARRMESIAGDLQSLRASIQGSQEAAMQSIRNEVGQAMRDQASDFDKLRQNMDEMAGSQHRVQEESAKRLDSVAGELSGLRTAMHRLEAEADKLSVHGGRLDAFATDLSDIRNDLTRMRADCEAQVRGQAHELERLMFAMQDAEIAHKSCAQDRTDILQRVQRLEEELAKLQHLTHGHDVDIQQLKDAHRECAAGRAELQRQQQASAKLIDQLLDEQRGLGGRLAEVQGLAQRLQQDLPRMAEAAARRAVDGIERARPPSPVRERRPASPVRERVQQEPVHAEVSESAYAVLRGPDGDHYELPSLENVVGRSTACDTCVPGSQAISNKHMQVSFASDGTASIKDLGSRNGTFVNEHRLAGHSVVIRSGDTVQLGVDGPSLTFSWGPAYYARWPRELERASGGRSSSRVRR